MQIVRRRLWGTTRCSLFLVIYVKLIGTVMELRICFATEQDIVVTLSGLIQRSRVWAVPTYLVLFHTFPSTDESPGT